MPTNDDRYAIYSANVRAEIARQGRRQTEVARDAGISAPAWNRRISGRVPWRAAELEAVARVLNVSLRTLTGADDEA